MNRIGIIGAMEEEVAILKEKMKIEQKLEKASMEFFAGTLAGREVVVVRSGIGKVNAGICTQILVDLFDVKAVINTGIAGSLDGRIDIGDIVISTDALHHDMDAVNFGYPLGQIPRMDTLSFPADEKLIAVAEEACRQVNPDIHTWTGRVVSGDQFIADRAVKDRIIKNFGGFCTEMEGAAIAQGAYLNQIPFVILRAISDKADDSATMDYPTFEKKAIEHSVRLVIRMMELLGQEA
ncbi:MAG: 5'-methylthioadenosine/adenosylhomocysteine nucleosidase [Lachnospiraceae bacterium]|nr:5'-methylthioadenosine/adenosylhomocysteine nucleosidase [Lachnospiraceae bacterium]